MIPLANRKILSRFIVFGLVIMLYDMILHSLLVVIHLAFEWFELGLEELIEHIFHTSRQQSQVIVFYLLWLMAFCLLYYLWRKLPGLYRQFKTQLLATSLEYKVYFKDYWSEQTSIQKVKWVTSFTVSVSFLALVAFS
ncbi:MAG: hypothetical protein Q7U18_13110 [Methylobacter sp.]|nr:hypothetical protein [Methylobacter sp.]